MSTTDRFREQHNQLLMSTKEMSSHLKADQLATNAETVCQSLAKLAGLLSVHLSMEDKVLYPKLLNHPDTGMRATTNKFINEMGTVKEVFTDYVKKWQNPTSIQKNPAGFINDTQGIFNTLSKRIERENNELYAMVDRLVQ